MSEDQKTQKYPGPLYAAAGFGDLAAEKLRELPDRVSELSDRARTELSNGRAQNELAELGGKLGAGLSTVRDRAQTLRADLADTDVRTDLRRFQTVARRRANGLADAAARNLATAQDRAGQLYDTLVARGNDVLDRRDVGAPIAGLVEERVPTAEPPAAIVEPVTPPVGAVPPVEPVTPPVDVATPPAEPGESDKTV
jgi:heparin binding hemagglutinin HbhA